MKVLNTSYNTKYITLDQFDDVVANITTGNFLGFNDDEMPSEGSTHNKALHISLRYVNMLSSKVLVDTGSLLNVISKTTLLKLSLEVVTMNPSALIVKDNDGSRRAVIGGVDLPIRIGPTTFSITFQVMYIHLT